MQVTYVKIRSGDDISNNDKHKAFIDTDILLLRILEDFNLVIINDILSAILANYDFV